MDNPLTGQWVLVSPHRTLRPCALDELRMYAGRNPRPADFDAYWETALRELEDRPGVHTVTQAQNPASGRAN